MDTTAWYLKRLQVRQLGRFQVLRCIPPPRFEAKKKQTFVHIYIIYIYMQIWL